MHLTISLKIQKIAKHVVGEAGIEPTTPGLEGRCSIQLSYSPTLVYCSFESVDSGPSIAGIARQKAAIAAARASLAIDRSAPSALR